jgi:uncharacterized protein YmfQ (DUF2313 family)
MGNKPPGLLPVPPDRFVRRTPEDYVQAFYSLLPQGDVWRRDLRRLVMRICDGLARYWAYVDGRAADLLERESDPTKTVELLPEWERAFGLPDPCFPEATTIGERQRMLVTKITWQGGQSRQYFIDLLAWLGFRVVIKEWSPFMAGISRVGDTRPDPGANFRWYVGPPQMRFAWTVQVGHMGLVWFRASAGQAGVDHHLEFRTPLAVECLLMRWKPAHTWLVFDYSSLGFGDPMEGTP